jgi:hypothetical protein
VSQRTPAARLGVVQHELDAGGGLAGIQAGVGGAGAQHRQAGCLPAETVEFSVPRASEERMPFVCGKSENRPLRVPAVADTDLPVRQAGHLNATSMIRHVLPAIAAMPALLPTGE